MNLRDKRISFNIKKASRLVAKDHVLRVVYTTEESQVHVATLAIYLDSNLDANGATRVCVIGNLFKNKGFQRFRYNPAMDKFDKI